MNLEGTLFGREDEGLPKSGFVTVEGAGRENADDLVRLTVQQRPARQDRRIRAKVVLPGSVAEDHYGSGPWLVILRREGAAKLKARGEHAEVIGRHRLAG